MVLPYNEILKTFDIEAAIKHHEFLYLLEEHKNEMIELEEQLKSIEKHLPDVEGENMEGEESVDRTHSAVTFQKIDGKFKRIFDKRTKCGAQTNQLMQQLLLSLSSTCTPTVNSGRMLETIMDAQ